MLTALLKKCWFSAHRVFDRFYALGLVAEQKVGLAEVRRLLREMVQFRPREKSAKPQIASLKPAFELLEGRDLPSTIVSAVVRTDDPQHFQPVQIGETQIDVNLGAARVIQGLDFDQSPGTSMGGNPALVYNSATVGVQPIVQILVTPDTGLGTPTAIKTQLTWNGTTQGLSTYFPMNANPVALGAQVNSIVAQTGRYPWSVYVEVDYAGSTYTASPGDTASVVVFDSSVGGQIDPYGAGWGIAGIDRLIPMTDGAMRVNGTGEGEFFGLSGGNYTSPNNDLGTLTQASDVSYSIASASESCPPSGNVCRFSGLNG